MLAFFNISGGEIVVIFLFVLLFFGAKSIPSVARNLGKGIRQVRDAMGDIQSEINSTARDIKTQVDQQQTQLRNSQKSEQSSKGSADINKEENNSSTKQNGVD